VSMARKQHEGRALDAQHMPREQTRAAFGNGPDRVERPCDYAAFGLFDLCSAHVDTGDGKLISVFAFAESEAR
jgi:hypothetical protein